MSAQEFLNELRRQSGPLPAFDYPETNWMHMQAKIEQALHPLKGNTARHIRQFVSVDDWANDIMARARAAGILGGFMIEAVYLAWNNYEHIGYRILQQEAKKEARKLAKLAKEAA